MVTLYDFQPWQEYVYHTFVKILESNLDRGKIALLTAQNLQQGCEQKKIWNKKDAVMANHHYSGHVGANPLPQPMGAP